MDNIKIRTCDICGYQTDNGRIMSNHKRWKHVMPVGTDKYNETIKKLSNNKKERVTKVLFCKECGKEFSVTGTEAFFNSKKCPKYCSSYCRHKQGSKSVDYAKVSKWAKEHTVGCYSSEWKIAHPESGVYKKTHSKRELEIVNFFKSNFPNDEWKQGLIDGSRRHNDILLNPDLWSKKLGVVIEYDGIWHFKDINGQLERKQKVDRELVSFCKQNGYRLIRVDEALKISNEQIVEAVYNSDKQLELFDSDRYNYLVN